METYKKPVFDRFIEKYVTAIYRKYVLTLIVFTAIVVLGIHFVARLKLKSDFAQLLPDHYQSVKSMNKIMERIGGLGSLYIAVETEDFEAGKRFTDDLVENLNSHFPKNTFKYIDYNIKEIRDFYEDNKYLYIDYPDLKEIHERLAGRIEWEKLKRNPLYISLEDEDEKVREFDIDDIINKYKKESESYDKTTDGYYSSEDGKLIAILTRPYGSSTSVDYSKYLMGEIEKVSAGLKPETYHPSIKIGFGGNFKTTLDEYDSLRQDILSTIILCVTLISFAMFLYYLRVRIIFLIGITIFVGTIITFTVTYFGIGYLNSQTAFLGAIIIGNGINYGLILLARYLEERKRKHEVLQSLVISVRATILPTFAAAITTSASFATLMIANNKGFSQFGFIGGAGMFLCWMASFTFLPALLTFTEKILPTVKLETVKPHRALFFSPFSKVVAASPKGFFILGVTMVLASVFFIINFVPQALEMDFSKLRNKESVTSGTAILNRRIGKIFSLVMNPASILADTYDQPRMICDAVYEKEKILLKGTHYSKIIDKCVSVYSFLPEDQDEKILELKAIKKTLSGKSLNFLNEEQKRELEAFRDQFDLRPLTKYDLPPKIQKLFEEKDGRIGLITYIYPSKEYGNLWDGRNLIRFADLVREVELKDGTVIHSSGSAVVFADMLEAIAWDGPVTTAASLLAVMLIVMVSFRTLRATALIISNLLVGVILMGGLLAVFDIKLNYFNFIAIPVTFGIGVDYAVNMYQRYRLEGKGSILEVIKTTGGAIALCSFTTVISYAVLMTANNQALARFGLVAIIGEFSTLFAALLFLPATVILLERFEDKRSKRGPAAQAITGEENREASSSPPL